MDQAIHYNTITSEATASFQDRSSKFICYVFPMQDEQDFKHQMQEIKQAHPKARHFCFAYILGVESDVHRLSDDGEPSGSAGLPIYHTLSSHSLTQIGAVVVRYFGGTKLGVPGLINAYKAATEAALSVSSIVTREALAYYTIWVDYTHMPYVLDALKHRSIEVLDKQFGQMAVLQIALPKLEVENQIRSALTAAFKMHDASELDELSKEVLHYELIKEDR